ncbi:MAG TPA: hypothetical protein VNQ33_02305 [Acidimicrobiales bacterium]|nr:hypothetical protein [Acidimicrobiales bacterium]
MATTIRSVAVVASVLLAGACGGEQAPSSQAAIEGWAHDDLGISNAETCLAPYIDKVDIGGVTRAELRAKGIVAVPPEVSQRVANALMVCGLLASPR